MLGIGLGLLAALGFGASAVFARIGLQRLHPATGTLVSLIVGVLITISLAVIFHLDDIFALTAIAFAWFLLSGFLNFPLGRLLNYTSVSKLGVSKASPIVGASPLFTAMLAVTVGGETINLPILLGTISIIGGIAFIVTAK